MHFHTAVLSFVPRVQKNSCFNPVSGATGKVLHMQLLSKSIQRNPLPSGKTVKPCVVAVRTGIVVLANRADAHIRYFAILCTCSSGRRRTDFRVLRVKGIHSCIQLPCISICEGELLQGKFFRVIGITGI